MNIRRAALKDLDQIRLLYYGTITTVNKNDYSEKQISVWAAAYKNIESWTSKINEQHFFVAELNSRITGFASITDKGYIDYMYVHKDFQRQGIATELLKVIEQLTNKLKLKKIWAEVSITARPFFAARGFTLTKIYTKKVADVEFEDSIMTKSITNQKWQQLQMNS